MLQGWRWGPAGAAAGLAARRCFAASATTASPTPDVEAVVIGAGVVGLAIARQLACEAGREVLVVEAGRGIGMETSSRNSEVIHAGGCCCWVACRGGCGCVLLLEWVLLFWVLDGSGASQLGYPLLAWWHTSAAATANCSWGVKRQAQTAA